MTRLNSSYSILFFSSMTRLNISICAVPQDKHLLLFSSMTRSSILVGTLTSAILGQVLYNYLDVGRGLFIG